MSIQPGDIWDRADRKRKSRSVSADALAKWETANGVKLPRVLRDALRSQNGGGVQYCDVLIYPLEKFSRLSDEFWEFADRSGFRKTDLAFVFGENQKDSQPFYVLNFNANGPRGEPSVCYHYNDGEFYPDSTTVEEFFADLIRVEPKPSVDWTETEKLDTVLHRETVTDGPSRIGSVVGKRKGKLFIYRHDVAPDRESYVKIQISGSEFSPYGAMIESVGSPPVYQMRFEPLSSKRYVLHESHRMRDGMWKNKPIDASSSVVSRRRTCLESLRSQILSPQSLSEAVKFERDTRQWAEFGKSVQSMSKDKRDAVNDRFAAEMLKVVEDTAKGLDVDFETLAGRTLKTVRKTARAVPRRSK